MPNLAPKEAAHFLFFAAIPPDAVTRRMAGAWRVLGTGERFRGDKLHLTLLPVLESPAPDPLLVGQAMRA
ncbi:MAG: hypothetical protein ACK5L9_23595, partial [Paracoccus sp. (in: a-proteobacteria)]